MAVATVSPGGGAGGGEGAVCHRFRGGEEVLISEIVRTGDSEDCYARTAEGWVCLRGNGSANWAELSFDEVHLSHAQPLKRRPPDR